MGIFLVFITLILAALLAALGVLTMRTNLLGWFLLISGCVYFFGVIIVYWMRGVKFWRQRSGGAIRREEKNDRSFWLIAISIMAEFFLPPVEYRFFPALIPRGIAFQVIGLFIILAGSILFIWARRELGKFYSGHVSVVEEQPLVQSGPYRIIRHPAYAGYLCIALGVAIGYSSIVGLFLLIVLLIPTLVYRIKVEERLLSEVFSERYAVYATKTKRLIPWIW